MMSGSKYILLLIFFLFILPGCTSKTNMYGGGGDEPDGPSGTRVMSVQYLKSLYRGYPLTITDDLEIHGQVTANDLFGTFPYTLVVQDETGGVEIKVSGDQLYAEFPSGQEIIVRCQGLVLGEYGGVVQLGAVSDNPDYQTGFIPYSLIQSYFNKSGKPISEVFAKRTTITGLEPRYVGVLIGLEGVQFLAEELSFSWCDEGTAATRHLIDQHGNTLQVRTVADALFANDILPQGNGYIEGILSYFNGNYQLRVFSGKNVFLTGERF